jgi:peptidoglycan/xylan/chitin deacetylase (PgdA/CDA1 family)
LYLRLLNRIPNKRDFLARSLGSLGILRLLEGLPASRRPTLVVLTYHRIAEPGIDTNPYYDPVISATPEAFRAQVRFLRDRFQILSLQDVLDWDVASMTSSGTMAVLITFDDGYRDNFDVALPILHELGAPAMFFIPTEFLQRPRLPWWDHVACAIKRTNATTIKLKWQPDGVETTIDLENDPTVSRRTATIMTIIRAFLDGSVRDEPWFLAQLDQQAGVVIDDESSGRDLFMGPDQVCQLVGAGMSVGSHGHSHMALAQLDEPAQRLELSGSKQILEQLLGSDVTAVAYPYGWPGTFTARTCALAAEAGYRLAFSSVEGVNHPGAADFDPMDLRRLNVGTGDSCRLLHARAALHGVFGRSPL